MSDTIGVNDMHHVLYHPAFPHASTYNPYWIFEHQMGPNVLWLTEWLVKDMNIKPGMRILDMGCGKSLSSIFLAREFDVEVWANDLWIQADDNWKRIRDAGPDNRIFPIHAEAHNLPFAEEFFDGIISMDSYQYYGTDELYLGYFHKFLKQDGEIGIVVPGFHREINGNIPEYFLRKQKSGGVFWEWDMCSFHTKEWWGNLWNQYPFIDVLSCEKMEDGGYLWLEWEKALEKSDVKKIFPSDVEALEADGNRTVTFIKVIAKRNNVRI
ncbi:MAG: methyltransferase domain-containing protein [Spirochaetales bacterium]|nr:methyltransferase domain-containing protein [Spirochaetales bacterium]